MLFRLWLNIPKNGQAELVFKGRDAIPRCWRMCVSTQGTLLKHCKDTFLVPQAMLFLSPRKLLPIALERILLQPRNRLGKGSHWVMIRNRNG